MNNFVPLREVARFIWFLKQKTNGNLRTIRTMHVVDMCRENAGISSFSPNPRGALKFLEEIEMIKQTGPDLRLSSQCIELVKSAKSPLYISEEQKEIIYVALLSHEEIGQKIRDLFELCNLTEEGFSAISVDTVRRLEDNVKFLIRILNEIGVLYWDGYRFNLDKKRLRLLDSRILRVIPMNESTLDKILLFQKKIARAAENFVVEWEKHRLVFQGDRPLINLVRRVSSENVNLGYDIVSVEGGKNGDTDRFIEVKSSCGMDFSFYWTSNEIDCARELGKNYWIYFVPRAHILPINMPIIHIIRDPVSCMGKTLKYTEKSLKVWFESSKMQPIKILNFGNGWYGVQC